MDWRHSGRFRNTLVCPGAMTMKQINEEIVAFVRQIWLPPKVIAIDYVQLVRTAGSRCRYERMSDACEASRGWPRSITGRHSGLADKPKGGQWK